MRKIAITGHREYEDIFNAGTQTNKLFKYLRTKYPNEEIVFITGGAQGIDQLVAKMCKQQKFLYDVYLAFPFDISTSRWAQSHKDFLTDLIVTSRNTKYINDIYSVRGYYLRDKAMVDDSDFVVAFWDGRKKGGTYITVKYALSKGKLVYNAFNEFKEIKSEDVEVTSSA